MTIIPAFPEPTAVKTMFLLGAAQLAAGCILNLALPHLGTGYHGTLAVTALVGILWTGGFGAGYMALITGGIELVRFVIMKRRRDGRLWTY